jgi:hypothetical protein
MALNQKIEISPDVISTEAQLDETLLMNIRTLAYFGLDPLGSKFWQAMQLLQDADEVIGAVSEQTGKSRHELEPILQSIMTGMERSGLLTLTER